MAGHAVVVVHGLWMPRAAMWLLARRLAGADRAAVCYGYRSVLDDFDANVARLAAYLARLPAGRLDYVGHSLGGVLLLAALAAVPPTRPGRVVCLGSPLAGSVVAARLAPQAWGRALLGRSAQQLQSRAPLPSWDGAPELGVIAGRTALGVGRLFVAFGEPHDGTVTVAETRLPGTQQHLVLPVGHMSMLWSVEVARATDRFLRHGRFAAAAAASS